MSQNFNKLLGSNLIKNDRETINENFDAIRSAHSGTTFPSKELVAGMEFFNTSTKKLYRLQPDLSTWTLELDLSSGTAVVAKASSADAANKASKDANGKDISTYVAKLESDVNNAFCINVYDGNDNKLGSVTIPETKVEIMTGASSSSAGEAGLVPQPKAGDNDKFLCGDGSFKEAGKVKSVNGKTGDVVVGEVTDVAIDGTTVTITYVDGTTKNLTTQDSTGPFTSRATSIGGASATKPAVVVTTYKSGTSWYRVWSDGWVEQGGYVNKTRDVACTITLPKAMKDTNYTTANGMFYRDAENNPAMITSISTTSITMKTASWGYGLSWYVCGQGA